MSVDDASPDAAVEQGGRRVRARWLVPVLILVAVLVVAVTALQRPWRGPVAPGELDLSLQLRVDAAPYVQAPPVYLTGKLYWAPPERLRSGSLYVVVIHVASGRALKPFGALPSTGRGSAGWDPRLDRLVADVDWLAPLGADADPKAALSPIDAVGPLTFVAAVPGDLGEVVPADFVVGVAFVDRERAWWAERLVP